MGPWGRGPMVGMMGPGVEPLSAARSMRGAPGVGDRRVRQTSRRNRSARLGLALALLLVGLTLMLAAPVGHADDGLVAHHLRIPLTEGTRTVTLWVTPGFDIGLAATGVPSARMLAQAPSGELVLSQMFEGKVSKLSDHDGDGEFEDRVSILHDLEVPHGLAFVGNALFVATNDQILRLDPWWDGSSAREVARLPSGGQHLTRTLALGPDGLLYVSIGSSCDACQEDDSRRAAILRMDPSNGRMEPVARGVRNAVGMTWSPYDGQLWVTDNGRNDLGDEIPPDEIDVVKVGADYGWPDCVGERLPSITEHDPNQCEGVESPVVSLPAHIAPLGL